MKKGERIHYILGIILTFFLSLLGAFGIKIYKMIFDVVPKKAPLRTKLLNFFTIIAYKIPLKYMQKLSTTQREKSETLKQKVILIDHFIKNKDLKGKTELFLFSDKNFDEKDEFKTISTLIFYIHGGAYIFDRIY